ncbi:ABC transporter permease [Chengkuizengella axinellae]|uniref:ABC transporter permease n=1 Tax=Chengkuizengella axinellae TaxID=3064388 RepID=A0ABT9IW68_9BACL|nr:ABC transporter permease [Chengkuizengella sp. 2205SS18-9]MDP5273347.1 ABC transporter permease [Chengkuizengella sp. 2205SS18-9]
MTRFLLRRLFFVLISLWVIISATFFLMKAVPGGPFSAEKKVPDEILKSLEAHYGLDKPLAVQYYDYLKSVVTWDLGPSFRYDAETVNQIINRTFKISLVLGLEALLLSIALGLFFGVMAALYHNKFQDYSSMVLAVIGMSVPSFILAVFLQYIFAIKFDIFPAGRFESPLHHVLPALSLAALPTAFIARLTRSNMLEVLQQDYIKTARAKGIKENAVMIKHAIRNAILPVVTYLGPLTAGILTGSFVVENIYGIPGLGTQFVQSITNRDYTVIMGTTVFYSIILVFMIFVVDMLYGVIDPRINITGDNAKGGNANEFQ